MSCINSLGTCNLCLQKLPYLRDSNRLPGVFITGESITNTNNSTNILKKSKSFLGLPIGTRRSCLMKKTGHEKSRDTVPLKVDYLSQMLSCLDFSSCSCRNINFFQQCFLPDKYLRCNMKQCKRKSVYVYHVTAYRNRARPNQHS